MAVVKNLLVRSGADFSALYKETKKAQQQLAGFQKSISGTMKMIAGALATVGVGALVKDSVKAAMTVEASLQQINRIMGSSSDEFQNWAKTQAAAYNMATGDALKYGATFGNLIRVFSSGTAETAQKTEELLQASSVIASATGRTMEDVMERIRSGLLGNTEAIEDLGIYAQVGMIKSTKAFKQFANGKSWDQLDYRTQQQIRLMSILEQATTNYGDAVNKNTNSAQQQFIAQLKNAQLALGQAFLPIYNVVLPALTSLAANLAYVLGLVAQFSRALFGTPAETKTQAAAVAGQAAAVDDLGDAYGAAGSKAKKAAGSLAGFDEINSLADNSAAGGGGAAAGTGIAPVSDDAAGGIAEAVDLINPKIKAMADTVRKAFSDLAKFIQENKDYIVSAIAGLLSAFAAFAIISNWSAIVAGLSAAFTGLAAGIAAISWPIVAIAAAIGLFVANLVYLWRTNDEFRASVLETWGKIKTFVTTVVRDMWGIIKGIWDKYGATLLADLAMFMGTIQALIVKVWNGFLKPLIENALIMLTWLWENHLKGLVTAIGEFIAKLVTGALELWNKFFAPVIGYLVDRLGPVFSTAFSLIIDVVGSVVAAMVDVATGIFEVLGGIVDFVVGVFTLNWKKAWGGVRDIFEGIFDGLAGIVKLPLNLIIDMVNAAIRGINTMIKSINKVPGINIPSVPTIPKLAQGGITNGPTMALIGDNPGGREVVSPLDDLKDILAGAVSTALMSAAQFGGGGGRSQDVVLQIDGVTFARLLNPYSAKETTRIGGAMIQST